MNKLIFNFGETSFTISEVEDGLYDLNNLRKQVDSLMVDNSPLKNDFKSTSKMNDWKKYLSEKEVNLYKYESSGRGRGAKTVANKTGLVAYASWLNVDFKVALEKAFVAISEGRDEDAREIVGESLVDLEFAKKVEERWKEYVKWSYGQFAEVNNKYGANLTRMVVKAATGASTKNNIKGKVDAGLIERCVDQGNGAAILAINATLDLVKNTMKTEMFKEMMKTRDGKKFVYKTLSQMLNWSE